MDGTFYSFTTAHDYPASVAEGCMDDDATKTTIQADNVDDPDYNVSITIPAITTGTYHDGASSILYFNRGEENDFFDDSGIADEFTFIILQYGGIGGVIRGTFSGTVTEEGSANTYPLTDGYFEVIRLADGAIVLK